MNIFWIIFLKIMLVFFLKMQALEFSLSFYIHLTFIERKHAKIP